MFRMLDEFRPELTPAKLSLVVSFYVLIVLNSTFWTRGAEAFAGQDANLMWFGVSLLLMHAAALLLFSVRFVFKPILSMVILIAAGAAYFVDNLGITIDVQTIGSATSPSTHFLQPLLTGSFLSHMAVFGVLPVIFILLVSVIRQPWQQQLAQTSSNIAVCLLVTLAIIYVNASSYTSILKQNRDLFDVANPAAPVASTVKYIHNTVRNAHFVSASSMSDGKPQLTWQ